MLLSQKEQAFSSKEIATYTILNIILIRVISQYSTKSIKIMIKAYNQSDLEQALQDQDSNILFKAPNASKILEKYLNKECRRKSRKVYIGVAFLILLLAPFSDIAIVSTIALTAIRPLRNYQINTHSSEKIELTKTS